MGNYMENVLRVREEIAEHMRLAGIEFTLIPVNINPCITQINENGGIGIEFLMGAPAELYTPKGTISFTHDYVTTNKEMQESILEYLKNEFKIKLVEPEQVTAGGVYGAVYAITRIPWTGEKIPVFEYKKREDYVYN